MTRERLLLLVLCMHSCLTSHALLAYDCTAPGMNVTEYDMTSVDGCEESDDDLTEKIVRMQLLQINEEFKAEVTTCLVTVSRIVSYCGMHSHTSAVMGGFAEYVMELRERSCMQLYDTGSVQLSVAATLTGLERESLNTRSVMLAGAVAPDGTCEGAPYSDQYGSWSKVIVQATVRVRATRYLAQVNTKTDVIHLQHGVQCPWSKGYCMDAEAGETYWKSSPIEGCAQENFVILYEGSATEVRQAPVSEASPDRVTYLVEQGEKIFALERTRSYSDCPFNMWRTEHPRLILAFPSESGFYVTRRTSAHTAYDLMLYINAKFVYMARVYERNFKAIASALSRERCLTRKAVLELQLGLAIAAPADFAYIYTGEPGHKASVVGEVVYISRCPVVQVSLRPVDRCYHELPVSSGNRSLFMAPRTRILSRYGTEVLCNPLLIAKYKIAGSWVSSGKEVHEVRNPSPIRAIGGTLYEYRAPKSVALGGIYTASEVSNMVDQIMFGTERHAAFSRIAGKVLNQPVSVNGLSLDSLVPQDQLEQMAETLVQRAWNRVMMFGSVVSSLLGVWFILKCGIWILESVSNLKILHDLFGWSFKLACSLSTALTALLVHDRVKVNLSSYSRSKQYHKPAVPEQNVSAPTEESHNLVEMPSSVYPTFAPGL
ncbi:unnamed protein product [Heligmosomoides polygyrus]|uniref:Glycoprotein n=1 Tax=Heligmosomoides polygyrus TaxID=6339 RepID=A0A183FN73_HELPZ|nr:unnamed protein product [Heligmosomoides polygyrus]